MNKQEIYKAAIDRFGKDSQIDMIEEECYEHDSDIIDQFKKEKLERLEARIKE